VNLYFVTFRKYWLIQIKGDTIDQDIEHLYEMHKTFCSEYVIGVSNDRTLKNYSMGLHLPGKDKIQYRDLAKTRINLWLTEVTECLLSKW